MENYIHTFELKRKLDNDEYNKLKKLLNKHEGLNKSPPGRIKEYFAFAKKGVRIKLITSKHGMSVYFIVNPKEVFENGNITDLFSEDDGPELAAEKIDELLSSAFGDNYTFEKLELTRVDLCVDLKLSSRKEVKEYIRLLYRTDSKKGYKIKGRKVKGYNRDAGFKCENDSAGVNISIYDKETQLLNIDKPKAAAKTKKWLRVEVQLKSKEAIYKYAQYESNVKQLAFCIEHSYDRLFEVIDSVLMDADYYTLDKAREIVGEHTKGKLRNRMQRLLYLISESNSVRIGIQKLKAEYPKVDDGYLKKMKNHYRELNVNIVTIGRERELKTLPSLVDKIRCLK